MTRAQRHPTQLTNTRQRTTVLLLASGLAALTACGSSHGSDGSASSSGTATGAPTPSVASSSGRDLRAQVEAEVLQLYSNFWAEQVKAYGQADIEGTNLKKYATKEALGRAVGDVLLMQKSGTATQGAPRHEVQVTSLALGSGISKASLRDCLDISNWKTVKRKSGLVQPFPSAQPLRYETTAEAEKWGKQWVITELRPDGSHPC